MGKPKAGLKFGDETLLQRVTRILKSGVETVVVVGAAGQMVPLLPDDVFLIRDEFRNKGPLSGIYSGLKKLAQLSVASAYVTSCDSPFLNINYVQFMLEQVDADHQISIVDDGQYKHVLAAAYSTSIFPSAQTLIEEDRLRPVELTELHPTKCISLEEARKVDLHLDTFINLNSPEDYEAALSRFQKQNG